MPHRARLAATALWLSALSPVALAAITITTVQFSANFSANTALANPYSEGGLLFSHTGFADDNGGCGYAGIDCEANPGDGFSQAFSGNYFATAGSNAYVRISSGDTALTAIEFAADSGFLDIHLLWETWLEGVRTGFGKVSLGAGGVGGVVGLSDLAGFNEVRIYAFDSASDNSGYSTAAIDSVCAFAVPLPGTLALALALGGLGPLATLCRREGRRD